MDKETVQTSTYEKCSTADVGTPQRNLHDYLHPLLLKKYSPFLDDIYFKRFTKNEFHTRRGELYLIALINEFNSDIRIMKYKNGGPDFQISKKSGFTFCLESIVPGGINVQQNSGQLLKSIQTSMQKKKDQYNKWINKKIIQRDEIFVVSIGFYGFDSVFILDWNILINHVFQLFKNQKLSCISAILLSKDCDQIAMSRETSVLFNDLRLIHNPLASNPLPVSSINVYQEYAREKLIHENNKYMTVVLKEKNDQIISHSIKDWRTFYS